MKKVKNIESEESKNSLENVKDGKIKKNKPKKDKKLKEAVEKLEQKDLAPKIENSNLKPKNNNQGNDTGEKSKKKNKKNKNKSQQNQKNQGDTSEKQPKVQNNGIDAIKKDKKSMKNKQKQENSETKSEETAAKELTEAELKKIEKKKAKKLAQKLKKQQKKMENKDETQKLPVAKTNGVKEEKKSEKLAKNNTDSATKVLSKKEKKALKRQMIKEQKLAAQQTRDPAVDAATVFVGNVPVNTKRVQLVRLFKDFAPVNSIRLRSAGGQVLHKHKQRKAAGSLNAYVVLKDKETAERALSLNGVEFKGHHLRVTLSTKNPQSHEKEEAKRTVFVGNLKYTATEESLREIFSSCGEIDYVRCLRDGDKGCKGVAYVCFKTPDAVGLALELNETIVDDRPINVERYSIKKLGAKEAREAQAAKEVKVKKGAKKRIENKKGKKNKTTTNEKDSAGDEDKKPKKSEFRGVKVESLKKKQKNKKKKSNDQMLKMAKKIAPKPKTE